MSRPMHGPLPGPNSKEQFLFNSPNRFTLAVSGEITANKLGAPLGSPRFAGKVTQAYMTLGSCGKDDSNALKLEMDVKVGGTSVFSTTPYISHVSGEAAGSRNTLTSGEGERPGVIDTDNNGFSAGDFLDVDLTLTRTASPTTEMQNAIIVVEMEPTD